MTTLLVGIIYGALGMCALTALVVCVLWRIIAHQQRINAEQAKHIERLYRIGKYLAMKHHGRHAIKAGNDDRNGRAA